MFLPLDSRRKERYMLERRRTHHLEHHVHPIGPFAVVPGQRHWQWRQTIPRGHSPPPGGGRASHVTHRSQVPQSTYLAALSLLPRYESVASLVLLRTTESRIGEVEGTSMASHDHRAIVASLPPRTRVRPEDIGVWGGAVPS